ncbi:MAG: hypothetical protein ACJAZW_003171 [Maritalea sp.]|jgi:hypothetical protein
MGIVDTTSILTQLVFMKINSSPEVGRNCGFLNQTTFFHTPNPSTAFNLELIKIAEARGV